MPTHSEGQLPILAYEESITRIGKSMAGTLSKENIGFLQTWEVTESSFGCSDRQKNAFWRWGRVQEMPQGKNLSLRSLSK